MKKKKIEKMKNWLAELGPDAAVLGEEIGPEAAAMAAMLGRLHEARRKGKHINPGSNLAGLIIRLMLDKDLLRRYEKDPQSVIAELSEPEQEILKQDVPASLWAYRKLLRWRETDPSIVQPKGYKKEPPHTIVQPKGYP